MASAQNIVWRQVENKIQGVPVELRALEANEVRLKITHSGLCHSDVFYISSGMVLGHEGVGIVEEVGSAVTEFKIGDRAGGGYLRDSCGKCKYCLTGRDIWCYNRNIYGEKDYNTGTFSKYYIGVETFLHKIPDELSSSDAAPLQCAGATVYSALLDVISSGTRVGIVGIGGLGHLAIQFADKLGAEVVVFSTSADKEEEAKKFGAKEFYLLSEPEKVKEPIDVLVLTGAKHPDFSRFMTKEILARTGTIVPLTADTHDLQLPSLTMFFAGYNIRSSLVASRKIHSDMLRFAAKHGIKPVIEEFPMDEGGFAAALDRLNSGKVRYRAVLAAQIGPPCAEK
ncbi:hypothetical protein B7463_g2716, partial [Scytalidium lignicola]